MVIIWVKPLASRMLLNICVLQNYADYWQLGEDQTQCSSHLGLFEYTAMTSEWPRVSGHGGGRYVLK